MQFHIVIIALALAHLTLSQVQHGQHSTAPGLHITTQRMNDRQTETDRRTDRERKTDEERNGQIEGKCRRWKEERWGAYEVKMVSGLVMMKAFPF